MKERNSTLYTHTHTFKHISHTSHKTNFLFFHLIFSYNSSMRRGWRLVWKEQRPLSKSRSARGQEGKERGNVERLLSVIIKIYTPVCTTYVSS